MKRKIIIMLLIFGMFLNIQNLCFAKHFKSKIKAQTENISKEENKNTDGVFFPMNNIGDNRVWVGTFQLVWNNLQDDIIKAPIQFTGIKSELADNLNKQMFKKDMISDDSYYIKSGNMTNALKEEIEGALIEKFNEKSDILDNLDWSNDEMILVYAMLKKDFEFIKEFEKLKNENFMGTPVKFFGAKKEAPLDLRQNINVLYYRNPDDYAVKLYTKTNDEVILYRTDVEESFEYYYKDLKRKTASNPLKDYFSKNDSMKIPYIDFNEMFQYKELTNKPIFGTDFTISNAIQTVDFKMDNKGAKLKSEAAITVGLTSAAPEIREKREFNFDKPFVLFLIEKDKNTPYFIAHFKNAELLKKITDGED